MGTTQLTDVVFADTLQELRGLPLKVSSFAFFFANVRHDADEVVESRSEICGRL